MAQRIIHERRCAICNRSKPITEFRPHSRKPERQANCKRCNQITRFWKYVEKTATCWNWTARRNADGYGCFDHGSSHRFSWELHFGQIPIGGCILHRCDNPPCVNPDHLYCGTKSDNYADMINRRRASKEFLSYQNQSKLSPEIVLQARELYATGKFSHSEIHTLLKVPVALITLSQAISRITWRHL